MFYNSIYYSDLSRTYVLHLFVILRQHFKKFKQNLGFTLRNDKYHENKFGMQ